MSAGKRVVTERRRLGRRGRSSRRLPINVRLALSSGWSIYAHHGTARDDSSGVNYEHREQPAVGEAKSHEYEARYREVPEDTRDLTGRIFGDPLPGRSELARKQRHS